MSNEGKDDDERVRKKPHLDDELKGLSLDQVIALLKAERKETEAERKEKEAALEALAVVERALSLLPYLCPLPDPPYLNCLAPRLVQFDLSKVSVKDRTNVLLASLDATEQLLACEAAQKLYIPFDHFVDDPSKNDAEELELVRRHLRGLTIEVLVEPFERAETASFATTQAFPNVDAEGKVMGELFVMRFNSRIYSRDLTGLPFQRSATSHASFLLLSHPCHASESPRY